MFVSCHITPLTQLQSSFRCVVAAVVATRLHYENRKKKIRNCFIIVSETEFKMRFETWYTFRIIKDYRKCSTFYCRIFKLCGELSGVCVSANRRSVCCIRQTRWLSVVFSVLVLWLDCRDHFVSSVRCCSDDAHDLCEESPKRAPRRISDRIRSAYVCECGESVFEHCIMMRKAHCTALRCKWNWCQSACRLQRIILASFLLIFKITHTNICDLFFTYFFLLSFIPLSELCPFYSRPRRIILHMRFQQFEMLLAEIRPTAYAQCTYTTDQNELLYNSSSPRVSSPFLYRNVVALHSYIDGKCLLQAELQTMNSIKKMNRFGGEWVSEWARRRDTWKIVVELHLVEENI